MREISLGVPEHPPQRYSYVLFLFRILFRLCHRHSETLFAGLCPFEGNRDTPDADCPLKFVRLRLHVLSLIQKLAYSE